MFKQKGDFEKLCLKLNYQFRNKELLAQAITTKSAWISGLQKTLTGHHEELAFFGDSLLRMIVDKILMEEFPYYKVGELSKVRDYLVKNANLSEAAKRLELEKFILMDANQAKQCQQGLPKLLADTIEAIICAIYKDSNESLTEIKRFILSHSSISKVLEEHRQEEEKRRMPIIDAITSNNLESVQKMLEGEFPPNFLFTHMELEYAKHTFNPSFIVHEKSQTPLGFALGCLLKIAVARNDPKIMLSIIECLLKYGANPNLHSKNDTALIRQLLSIRTNDGKFIDTLFARYRQLYKNKQNEHLLNADKILKKEYIPGWEKITDRVVEMLCKYGAKLDEENYSQSNTLLELAVIHKQAYKLDLLLSYKINPNIRNKSGKIVLHLVTEFGDELLINKLLKAGADPTIADKEGCKPFDYAPTPEIKMLLLKAEIEHGSSKNIKEINVEELNKSAVEAYKTWKDKRIAEKLSQSIQLFSLVLNYQLSKKNNKDKTLVTNFYNLGSAYFELQNFVKAKALLERAYYLYLIHEQQFIPKTDKFLNRFKECEEILIKNESLNELNETSKEMQHTKGDALSQNEQQRTMQLDNLFNREETYKKLLSAIRIYHASKIESLLKEGANPDAASNTGKPILHDAIETYAHSVLMAESTSDLPYNVVGNFPEEVLKIIALLLKWGADPNQSDQTGKTALHVAAIIDKPEIVTGLLKYGADPTIRDHANNCASHYAKNSRTRDLMLSALQLLENSVENINNLTHSTLPVTVPKETITTSHTTNNAFFAHKSINQRSSIMINNNNNNINNNTNNNNSISGLSHNLKTHKPLSQPPALKKNNKNTYKNSPCKFFKVEVPGSCKKGDQCDYIHGKIELRQ